MDGIVLAAIIVLGLIGVPIFGAVVAKRRGRSPVGWFLLILVTHVIGLGILIGLPRLNLTCPFCAEPHSSGAASCSRCFARLPDRLSSAMLVEPGETYDEQCADCATPYRSSDYRADAEHIYCSWCRKEIPRRLAAVAPASGTHPG